MEKRNCMRCIKADWVVSTTARNFAQYECVRYNKTSKIM